MLVRRSAIVLASALVGAACATGARWEVVAKSDPNADFRSFKTFAFLPADQLPMEGTQMSDPVTRRNIEGVIARELQAKGLSLAGDGNPSLFVGYFADVYQGPDRNRPAQPGMADSERQGEITVHLIDASTHEVVWRGEAWARDPRFKDAEKVIAELLRLYPPKR